MKSVASVSWITEGLMQFHVTCNPNQKKDHDFVILVKPPVKRLRPTQWGCSCPMIFEVIMTSVPPGISGARYERDVNYVCDCIGKLVE